MNSSPPVGLAPFVFDIGDSVPDFALPDPNGAMTGLLTHSRGNPIVYIICTGDYEGMLAPFVAGHAAGAFGNADVFAITRQRPYDNGILAERLQIHFGVLSDEKGVVTTALARGDLHPGIPPQIVTLVLDPGLRITSVFRDGDGHVQAEKLREALSVKGQRSAAMEVFNPAPVLIVPSVLNGRFCQRLRDYFETGPSRMGGTLDNISGVDNQLKVSSKVRRDLNIGDEALKNEITGLLIRRLLPEIKRAYDFDVAGAGEFKIGRYDGVDEGHFKPHRDNIAPSVTWRRFALSLLLNDASEYDGGGMRFSEYSDHIYGANAGDAIVFSCSLLHEVMAVTRGSRYILLAFLYGPTELQAMQQGQKNSRQ